MLNIIFLPTLILSAMKLPVLRVFEPILELEIFSTDEVFLKTEQLIMGESLTAINWLHTAEYFLLMALLIFFFYRIKEANPECDTMIKLFLCLLPISRAHSVLRVPPPTPVSSTPLPWTGPLLPLLHPSHSATEQVSTEYHS